MEQQGLPEDVVAEVLGRVQAPRSLAWARCVCKSWRAIVDSRRLLRADLLPLSLAGVFVEFDFHMLDDWVTELFFSRSPAAATTTNAAVSGDLTYAPGFNVVGHCNGLLLLAGGCVANPTTRQWARLPEQPPPPRRVDSYDGRPDYWERPYLAFNPAVSPQHYEVVLVPVVLGSFPRHLEEDDTTPETTEWPPALYETRAFSSATGRWEERSFIREGDPAGTMAYMRRDRDFGFHDMHNAVYWRGALYVHGQMNFVYKFSLANGTYRVIRPPAGLVPPPPDAITRQQVYLGSLNHGVSCAAVDDFFKLRVWTLDELSDPPAAASHSNEWVLKHQNDLRRIVLPSPAVQDDDKEFLTLLGFHPFQDIVFFNISLQRGLAYDLGTSTVQDLGDMCPKDYGCAMHYAEIRASFPYTLFWMHNSLPTAHANDAQS